MRDAPLSPTAPRSPALPRTRMPVDTRKLKKIPSDKMPSEPVPSAPFAR